MDFVTLATELDTRRLLRLLTDVLGDDDETNRQPESNPSSASPGYDSSYSDVTAASRPFFSKTAEAELYLLATNFLLYVAMVLITTLVSIRR